MVDWSPLRALEKTSCLLAALFLSVFVSLTLFFDTYRNLAFQVTPLDQYIPYVLYLLDIEGGELPGKPFVFRYFSVAISVPLYEIMPSYRFTNVDSIVSHQTLQAMQIFSFVSYIAAYLASVVMALQAKNKFKGGNVSAIVVFLVSILVIRHTSVEGVDAIAILLISLLLYFYRKKVVFVVLIFLSVGFNEKIVFIFFLFCWGRLLFHREMAIVQILSVSLALLLYFGVYNFWPIDSVNSVTQFGSYPSVFMESLSRDFTLKGAILNLSPLLFLVLLCCLASLGTNKLRSKEFFLSDILVLGALFVISHSLPPVIYNAGRIMMHTYPLYLPVAVAYVVSKLVLSNFCVEESSS